MTTDARSVSTAARYATTADGGWRPRWRIGMAAEERWARWGNKKIPAKSPKRTLPGKHPSGR